MRITRIDEIPQLVNVLKGEMSLVGPRPEVPELALEFTKKIPKFPRRLDIKPGITGLAQVNGGYELEPAEKLKYDLEYIEKRSILLDIKILAKTVLIVITGNGAR